MDKVDAVREALSHSHPDPSLAELFELGLDLLIAQHAKRKGLVAKPRKERRPAKPDHLSAEVKRAVWIRDGGCCQWKLHSGGICGSRRRIEFDHRRSKALGGPPTVENIRLLCHFHNGLAARQVFGDAWMDQFTGKRPTSVPVDSVPLRGREASRSGAAAGARAGEAEGLTVGEEPVPLPSAVTESGAVRPP